MDFIQVEDRPIGLGLSMTIGLKTYIPIKPRLEMDHGTFAYLSNALTKEEITIEM